MKPTWIIHFIPCGQPSCHTHGLDAYGSLELELNLPLTPHRAGLFINLVANEIAEKGKRYRSGDREDDVFNLPFYLFETTPIRPSRDNDHVLRILFCDSAGKYPVGTGMHGTIFQPVRFGGETGNNRTLAGAEGGHPQCGSSLIN